MSRRTSSVICTRLPPEIWCDIAENLLWDQRRAPLPTWKSGTIVPFLRTCKGFHELSTSILFRHLRWFARPDGTQRILEEVLAQRPLLYNVVRSMNIIGYVKKWTNYHGNSSCGKVDKFPPLALLTGLLRLHIQDVNITSQLHLAIVSLPVLQELSILRCNLYADGKPEFSTAPQHSTTVGTIKLDWIQQEGRHLETFLVCFPNLHSLRLTTYFSHTRSVLGIINTIDVASTLTSLRIVLPYDDAVTSFTKFLDMASNLEVIDIGFSTVNTLSLRSDAIPRLHTYRGPPQLAEFLVKGRGVSNIAFIPTREEPHVLERHMKAFQMSSTPIRNVSIYPPSSWDAEYTQLVKRYAGNECVCFIIQPGIQDSDLLEATIIPSLRA